MHRSSFAGPAVVASLAILLTAAPARGQDLGLLGLGVALASLMDQLDQAIHDAQNSGQALEIEAGRQASIAIESARNAYSKELNETVNKLSPEIRNTVDQLQQLVTSISKGAFSTVDEAALKAQIIVNALPFSNGQPQVSTIRPRFVVPSIKAYPTVIDITGNFVDSGRAGYQPTLIVYRTSYQASCTTSELKFVVPTSELFPVASPSTKDGQNDARFATDTVDLRIPWREPKLLGILHDDRVDDYRVLIGALPTSPGQITVVHHTPVSSTETKTFVSNNFHQCSTRECGNNDDKDHEWSVRPDDGWTVVRGTSAEAHTTQGDVELPTFVSDDGNVVVYKASTIHHAWGSSGSIDFTIRFQETRVVTVTQEVPEPLHLFWGDSHAFSDPAGSWMVRFDGFDGHHAEFAGSEDEDKFIKIENQEGSTVIMTRDPASLVWP